MIDNSRPSHIQDTFRALADPTRRSILLHLSEQDMTIGEVCGHFDMTRAAVKKHLNILEESALISVHTRGRERINHLEPQGLKPANEWILYFGRFWDERLSKLQDVIEHKKISGNQ